MDIFALLIDLVGPRHDFIKFFLRHGHQARMRYPGTIMPIVSLAVFIRAHFRHGFFICLRVVLNGNLGSHTTDSMGVAPVARLDSK